MKIFTGLMAASSLFLAATAANAQDAETSAVKDYDQITGCIDGIKQPAVITATEKPTANIYIVAKNSKDKASCQFDIKYLTNDKGDVLTRVAGFAQIAGEKPSAYHFAEQENGIAFEIQKDGATYKVTPLAERRMSQIEIKAPTALLITDEEDTEFLQEQVKDGTITMKTEGDMTVISVAKGDYYDWMPEELADNIREVYMGSLYTGLKFNQSDIEEVAKISVRLSQSILIPETPKAPAP